MAQQQYTINLTTIKETRNAYLRTINIHRKDKRPIEIEEIEHIANEYVPDDCKSIIRALNIKSWSTLKSLSEDHINIQSYNDYYKGKVTDPTKFEKFIQLSITVTGNQTCPPGAPFYAPGSLFHAPGLLSCDPGAFCALGSTFCTPTKIISTSYHQPIYF